MCAYLPIVVLRIYIQILMNVQLAPKLVMSMVSVMILMAVTIVHVCKDMKEMALTAQVINPLYMWLCMISSLFLYRCE